MPTSTIIGIVIAVVIVLAVLSLLARQVMLRRHLRQRFGPEYEREVESQDSRRAAERELADREKRHDKLELHAISPTARDSFTLRWTHVQEEFVDRPSAAVTDADRLLTDLMAERGYPTEGFEQQSTDLSVEHAGPINAHPEA